MDAAVLTEGNMKNSRIHTALLVLTLFDGTNCTVHHCDYYPDHCVDDVGDPGSSDETTDSGSESGLDTTTDTETTTETSDTDTSDTETTETGADECTLSSECAAEDPLMPICEGGLCVPCTEHEQCAASACNMATGECMPTDRVWWVDQSAPAGGDGTEASPYDSVAPALGQIGDGEQGVIVIRKSADYGQIKVEHGKDVAILGVNLPVLSSGADALLVESGSRVFASKLMIAGNHEGIACADSSVWLADSLVLGNEKRGIIGDHCSMHVSRSRIVNNYLGGIVATAGSIELVNTMVGGSLAEAPALRVDGAAATVLYSTLCGGAFLSPAMICSGQSMVNVRNSLMMSEQPDDEIVSCATSLINDSALEMDFGGSNVSLGQMDAAWFVDYPIGQLHLSDLAPPEIATAAVWVAGDPRTDIDGESRPSVDGAPDFAGADVAN